MLFSAGYQSSHKQEADEIRCPCNQLGLIFDFIKENPNKRYNIINPKEQDFNKALEQINFVREVADNYTVECEDINTFLNFIDKGINAYLRFAITDWEDFNNMLNLKATDIYIDGPLCFQMDKIEIIKNNCSVNIRSSPTVSPNCILIKPSPNSFFIRPEDLNLYDKYIDIIDFKAPFQEQEDALFSIYKRGTFNYDLDNLIIGLTPKINNILLDGSNFTKYRLNCNQKCKIPGRTCHYCETTFKVLNNSIKVAQIKQKD